MKTIGFIPLRKGSKGIPGKNKKKILGRRLYQWSLSEAIFSKLDEVYVFTNDKEILFQIKKEYNWTDKVKVILRSEENANDTATTESAMIEFSTKIEWDFEVICLLQATSPLTSREDINNSLDKINIGYDSTLSVVNTKRFIWDNEGKSLNYNYRNRPRRQEFKGLKIENGAVYCTSKHILSEQNNRLGGKIGLIEMDEESLIEIDEPSDFVIVENLLLNRLRMNKSCNNKIKLLVLDVDGVFTPGNVGVSDEGELFKTFSLRDGMGIENLKNETVEVVVMTSEDSKIVQSRMDKLKLELYMGVKDKYSRLDDLLINKNLKRSEVAYLGDDINDLVNICSVGWGICPNNALESVKFYCDLVLNNNGGDMAIREASEFIIKYNKRFDKLNN